MEQKKPLSSILAGLLIAGIAIIYSMIGNFAGSTGTGVGMLQYVLIIVALVFFINIYGKANNYNKTFGELFQYGFKASAVYTLVFIAFLLILMMAMPEMKEKALEQARIEMEKRNMSDSEIEQGLSITGKYFWIAAIGVSMFFLLLIGCIGALLGAAITKKNPQNPLDQFNP